MANRIFVSKQVPFPHYEGRFGVAYRIEIDNTLPIQPLQRHIWIMADGTERADDWIRSIRERPETLIARGYREELR